MWANIIKLKKADHDQFLHFNFNFDLANVLQQLGAHCFEKMFGIARVAWCLESSHLNLNLGTNPHSFLQSIPYIWLTVGLLICSTGLKKTRGMPNIICFLRIIRL